jgi:uncharacterized membrane protein
MTLPEHAASKRSLLSAICIVACVSLALLCVLWEIRLAPIKPGGSWLALKALPICLVLPGLIKKRLYSYQVLSLLILLYLAEGLVRATSDRLANSVLLAWGEVVVSLIIFVSVLMYVQTFKNKKPAASTA